MKKIFLSITLLIALLFTTNVNASGTAELKTGDSVNLQMKRIASKAVTGDYYAPDMYSLNGSILEIKRAYSINPSNMIEENKITPSSSENPVYMWFDTTTGIMYYYTEADKIYLSEYSARLFADLTAVTKIDLSIFDTSRVITMFSMFNGCISLTELDLSKFDTSNVTDMSTMFAGCSALTTLNLTNFNTSKVTDMSGMFSGCSNLKKLYTRSFNTSNVTDMRFMFQDCSSITGLNLTNFNTSKVTNMMNMFAQMTALKTLNVSSFDTSKVEDMSGMFLNSYSLTTLDLRNFNTTSLVNMNYMFMDSAVEDLDLSSFDTSNVEEMHDPFSYNTKRLDISNFRLVKIDDNSKEFLRYLFYLTALKTPKSIASGIEIPLYQTLYKNGVGYDSLTSSTPKSTLLSKEVSLEFDKNGAYMSMPANRTVYAGEELSITNPSSNYYNFIGWCLDSGCTQVWTENYIIDDTVLYANWTGKISMVTISTISDRTYTGSAITPNPIVKLGKITLTKGKDYTLSYKNNVNAGTATVTVTGVGDFIGSKSTTFKIVGGSPINGADVTFPTIANQVYTGSQIKPSVTLKYNGTTLKQGTDYTIVYGTNVDVGIGRVKIVFKGNYTGTRILQFKIIPAGTTITKLTNPSSGTIRVQYNESVGATGYQIAYRAKGSSTWSYARTSGLLRNINGLNLTRYEVKVRPWATIDGTNYYGSWSTSKYITIS